MEGAFRGRVFPGWEWAFFVRSTDVLEACSAPPLSHTPMSINIRTVWVLILLPSGLQAQKLPKKTADEGIGHMKQSELLVV